jgi:hypothetical protein
MERRVGDADKPLTVEEVKGELNLRFEKDEYGDFKR